MKPLRYLVSRLSLLIDCHDQKALLLHREKMRGKGKVTLIFSESGFPLGCDYMQKSRDFQVILIKDGRSNYKAYK